MWEINNLNQLTSLIISVILGVSFCAFYDIFRAFRTQYPPRPIILFLQDILYFLIISFVTFIFLLSITNGEIRGYILFGIILGFIAFYFTISPLFLSLILSIIKVFGKANLFVLKGFYTIFSKIDNAIIKFLKIVLNCFKKGLKKGKYLLYNKE